MDSITSSNLRLKTLAKQLPLGKSPIAPHDNTDGDDDKEKDLGEGTSQTLLPSIRRKKAAVLVCLFQGNSGDFRVILTKRSANLSSYSGGYSSIVSKIEVYLISFKLHRTHYQISYNYMHLGNLTFIETRLHTLRRF